MKQISPYQVQIPKTIEIAAGTYYSLALSEEGGNKHTYVNY